MAVIYMTHPYSGETPEETIANRNRAIRWAAWIATTFRVSVSADWIWLTMALDESAENRKLGINFDFQAIEKVDELWSVGGRLSNGALDERVHAYCKGIYVRDTFLFFAEPIDLPRHLIQDTRFALSEKGLLP